MNEEPYLNRVTYEFSQEGNTNGTTNNEEELIITVESSCASIDKEGGFFIIRTNGWSINSDDELTDLFNKIKNLDPKNGSEGNE
jgi:hypothetical protein